MRCVPCVASCRPWHTSQPREKPHKQVRPMSGIHPGIRTFSRAQIVAPARDAAHVVALLTQVSTGGSLPQEFVISGNLWVSRSDDMDARANAWRARVLLRLRVRRGHWRGGAARGHRGARGVRCADSWGTGRRICFPGRTTTVGVRRQNRRFGAFWHETLVPRL